MKLPGVALLLADTVRSRAYAQALRNEGFTPEGVLLVRAPGQSRWGQTAGLERPKTAAGDLFVPDLEEPLPDTVSDIAETVTTLDRGSVNHPGVVAWIQRQRPAVIFFSGFGGELVRDPVLKAGSPLLHFHSGWLPDYRGSTTVYYSYLSEGHCAVSAITLQREIDSGPIIKRKRYPPPPKGMDVDYYYDSMIRADLLCDVARYWAERRQLPPARRQPASGTTYFIIHPVLKHLALERINADPGS